MSRVAKEVGTDGKLGGQAQVLGVGGVWKDLTDNVNQLAANLTGQVRNIAEVTTAVAKGDLSKKITVDVKGEILELKSTINTMVDQLNGSPAKCRAWRAKWDRTASSAARRRCKGVGGVWKDLTDNVNSMAANLTGQVRNIAEVTTAVAKGDLSKKITVDVKGEILELKNTINTMVDQLNAFAARSVARGEGSGHRRQARRPGAGAGVAGVWKDLTDNVNFDGRQPHRPGAQHRRGHHRGGEGRPLEEDHGGREGRDPRAEEHRQHHGGPAQRVRRRGVARGEEVGTEGKLGGQAQVAGVAGVWKDLTDNVNSMAANLTGQVRNIAEVTTAVAKGDLSKKITVDVKGEILELKSTINTMVDQLNAFASEVSRVAREVGTEGKLGGQAQVQRRRRGVEGPDRQRELDGRQPHRPGAQHRRGDHRGGARRSLEEDHGGRARRDPRAQEHVQHHGGPAQRLRGRSFARGAGKSAPTASSAARRR